MFSWVWWKKQKNIKAIHDNDLEFFLHSIGYLDKINKNELFCSACNKLITLNNLGLLVYKNQRYEAICDDYKCLSSINVEETNNE